MVAKVSSLFHSFFESERASSLILIFCTVFSLVLANSSWGAGYAALWQSKFGVEVLGMNLKLSLEHWINDGLMAVFFLLIGLEIERELYIGELSHIKKATLPIFAAVGGMLFPSLIHFVFNNGTETQSGVAIPMATDIAFALGALSLLGSRVPLALKVFLTALAIVDDLGAIIVIALFYVDTFSAAYFWLAMAVFVLLLILNRWKFHNLALYLLLGAVMWFLMLQSGVHATITGVLLAFAIPFGKGDHASPSYVLQEFLHKPVAFLIMPLFALANTGVPVGADWLSGVVSVNGLGIILGLCVGKPLGILLGTVLGVRLGVCSLPAQVSYRQILGVGFLGGIGFTMSIFISLLAFDDTQIIHASKIAILVGSVLSGIVGILVLKRV